MTINKVEIGSSRMHTNEINDIISTPPSWMLRWGISVFFFLLIISIGLSNYVHLKEVFKTTLIIRQVDAKIPIGKSFVNNERIGEIIVPKEHLNNIQIGQKVLIKFQEKGLQSYEETIATVSYINPKLNTNSYFKLHVIFQINDISTAKEDEIFNKGTSTNIEVVMKDVTVFNKLSTSFYNALGVG